MLSGGATVASDEMLHRLVRAVVAFEKSQAAEAAQTQTVLVLIKEIVEEKGLRIFAQGVGVDAGYLSRILSGKRRLGAVLVTKLGPACGAHDAAGKNDADDFT